MPELLLLAHRGDTTNFPENTMAAFASAFEHGADGIELDVQYHNHELIVVHDYLFDRTAEYPKLHEVLEEFADDGRLEIEVKCLDLDFLSPFKVLIDRYRDADIEITTSVLPLAPSLREAFPSRKLGFIFPAKEFEDWMTEDNFFATKIVRTMQLLKGNIAHVPWPVVRQNPALAMALHQEALLLHSHMASQKPELTIYEEMVALGVDQCTFDDISLIEAVRG